MRVPGGMRRLRVPLTAALQQHRDEPGRAVQVDSIKTRVESAFGHLWFQRLKLKHDEPLSNFAFNCNLRHYSLRVLHGGSRPPELHLGGPGPRVRDGGMSFNGMASWGKLLISA